MSLSRRGVRSDVCIVRGRRPLHLLGDLVVAEARHRHHAVAKLPVHRRGHRMLGCELQRVDHAQDLRAGMAGHWQQSVRLAHSIPISAVRKPWAAFGAQDAVGHQRQIPLDCCAFPWGNRRLLRGCPAAAAAGISRASPETPHQVSGRPSDAALLAILC